MSDGQGNMGLPNTAGYILYIFFVYLLTSTIATIHTKAQEVGDKQGFIVHRARAKAASAVHLLIVNNQKFTSAEERRSGAAGLLTAGLPQHHPLGSLNITSAAFIVLRVEQDGHFEEH